MHFHMSHFKCPGTGRWIFVVIAYPYAMTNEENDCLPFSFIGTSYEVREFISGSRELLLAYGASEKMITTVIEWLTADTVVSGQLGLPID